MTPRLVGSEMCIRDSLPCLWCGRSTPALSGGTTSCRSGKSKFIGPGAQYTRTPAVHNLSHLAVGHSTAPKPPPPELPQQQLVCLLILYCRLFLFTRNRSYSTLPGFQLKNTVMEIQMSSVALTRVQSRLSGLGGFSLPQVLCKSKSEVRLQLMSATCTGPGHQP